MAETGTFDWDILKQEMVEAGYELDDSVLVGGSGQKIKQQSAKNAGGSEPPINDELITEIEARYELGHRLTPGQLAVLAAHEDLIGDGGYDY